MPVTSSSHTMPEDHRAFIVGLCDHRQDIVMQFNTMPDAKIMRVELLEGCDERGILTTMETLEAYAHAILTVVAAAKFHNSTSVKADEGCQCGMKVITQTSNGKGSQHFPYQTNGKYSRS